MLGQVSLVSTSEGYDDRNDCFNVAITEELNLGGKTSDQEFSDVTSSVVFDPEAAEDVTGTSRSLAHKALIPLFCQQI